MTSRCGARRLARVFAVEAPAEELGAPLEGAYHAVRVARSQTAFLRPDYPAEQTFPCTFIDVELMKL